MTSDERPIIRLADNGGGELYAIWSRSGKRLVVTVDRGGQHAQVELRPEQVVELARYLTDD